MQYIDCEPTDTLNQTTPG